MPKRATVKSTKDISSLLRSNKLIRQRLAKFIALHCFRNTKLEDLHAGYSPSTEAGDYSDVTVTSPFGEIPWNRLSRLNDSEMKDLMISVVQRCYGFVHVLADAERAVQLLEALQEVDVAPTWNEPSEAVPFTANSAGTRAFLEARSGDGSADPTEPHADEGSYALELVTSVDLDARGEPTGEPSEFVTKITGRTLFHPEDGGDAVQSGGNPSAAH